jgi:TetR/AcrR family transcriptional regulator, transcriptional repressor for nem operon
MLCRMTNSATATIAGKRERLVESATLLIHEHGVRSTTLADIAERADVPLGNVYYYFKTKDEIVAAVVDEHLREVQALLAHLDARRTPRARLKGLTRKWADGASMVAQSGCPLGSLCSELAKDDPKGLGAEIFNVLLSWVEAQFRQLDRREAPDLALMLLSAVQGAALLSNTFGDPSVMTRQVRQLDRWIDSFA